jgi:hypothetical protein
MENFLKNKDSIFALKKNIKENENEKYYTRLIFNEQECNINTVSIVLKTHETSRELYYTLSTIANSSYKDLQVIIVDDSEADIVDVEKIKTFSYHIELLKIKNKIWINSLVNYNIGFQHVKGGVVIIQNSKVCHVGDVIRFVKENMEDEFYDVFEVKSSCNLSTNEIIMNEKDLNADIFEDKKLFIETEIQNPLKLINEDILLNSPPSSQLDHRSLYFNRDYDHNFLYLTAMTINTFKKLKGFSYDYTMGHSYHDDDFILRLLACKINIRNRTIEECDIGGIHLFNRKESQRNEEKSIDVINDNIYSRKKCFYYMNRRYIDLTELPDNFESYYRLLQQKNRSISF